MRYACFMILSHGFRNNISRRRKHAYSTKSSAKPCKHMKVQMALYGRFQSVSPSGCCGRPARFLAAISIQAQLRLEAVIQLAEQAGLPNLREYVVGQQIVLYAHSESDVVLLAIKHQRQLVYSSEL